MRRFISKLAIIWRLASPYFRSEDRWAGGGPPRRGHCHRAALVAIDVMINHWNNRFYNALQDRDWDAFVSELLFLHTRCGIHPAGGLSALPQSMAANPLAALDDAALSRALALRLPTTVCSFWRRRGQP